MSDSSTQSPIYVGQLLCGGFEGMTVTSQAYHLIVKHHVSTMILSRKNAVSVKQITQLIRDLQHIARTQAGYKYPLIFAVDEEGGMMNSLFDKHALSQFPGAMALAATGDTELVYKVSKALATELKHIGFSVILGPVLDVITKLSHQLVGVRSFGTTLEEVTKYGKACARGLKDGGLMTVGKHFPGIGNAGVDSLLELPMMADSLDQIKSYNSVPFAELIKDGLLDGISAAGCGVPTISPDETHACLSPVLINQLLRQELGFEGFVISECLEMEALYHSIGLGQGVILAIYAGCDLVMVCHDLALQNEAVDSMEKALANGNLDEDLILTCIKRIETVQKQLPSWDQIFPDDSKDSGKAPFPVQFPKKWEEHQQLSSIAYRKSITLVRDYQGTLPITKYFNTKTKARDKDEAEEEEEEEEAENLLILSPLLNPIYPDHNHHHNNNPRLYTGEEVFQHFGNKLSEHPLNAQSTKPFNVLHTTYTANGLTALHEKLIENSQLVIVLTSEASRNMYQIGIVKYVSILCGANPSSFHNARQQQQLVKPLVIVATSSPYDFFYNKSIGSAYLCTYDYTNNVLDELVGVLMGDYVADGCIPGEKKFVSRSRKRRLSQQAQHVQQLQQLQQQNQSKRKKNPQPRRRWLVDEFNMKRDWSSLVKLWKTSTGDDDGDSRNGSFSGEYNEDKINYQLDNFYRKLQVLLASSGKTQKHFVVRNSSLNILYGIVLTWVDEYQDVSLDGYVDDDDEEDYNDRSTQSKAKVGSVMYILVDKSKRLQSIGKNLHARAIRYLTREQHCTTVILGNSLPMIALPGNTNFTRTVTSSVLPPLSQRIATSFMNSVGWDIDVDDDSDTASTSRRRSVLVLPDLSNWSVPKKIFRELMIVGVRFDICTRADQLMNLISKCMSHREVGATPQQQEWQDEKNSATKQLYMEAIKYLSSQSRYEVKIIIALEPTNQNVIGSIILFTNQSRLASFHPFIDEVGSDADKRVLIGAMTEPVIDPSYSNLTEIFKYGLICSGITFLKSNFSDDNAGDSSMGITTSDTKMMNQCIIVGLNDDKSINGVKEIGFQHWRHYYDYYDKKHTADSIFASDGVKIRAQTGNFDDNASAKPGFETDDDNDVR